MLDHLVKISWWENFTDVDSILRLEITFKFVKFTLFVNLSFGVQKNNATKKHKKFAKKHEKIHFFVFFYHFLILFKNIYVFYFF